MFADRADEQAAGAATLDHEPIGGGVAALTRCSAQSMKSVKVLSFFIMRPCSRHSSPISPPPRM